jgi:hypothetical protein
MLDPWIIEEIRRREEDQRRRQERPQLEIRIETPADPDRTLVIPDGAKPERGVAIIDFSI